MSKAVLILVDGMRPDALEAVSIAKEWMNTAAYTLQAQTVFPSVTLPCHMSLFHSVDPQRHGILSNTYTPQVRPIPGLCEALHQQKKRCAFFYNWEELRDLARPGSLTHSCFAAGHDLGYEQANRMVTDAAISYITEHRPDFVFVYLGWADAAGHDAGWMGEEYMRSVNSSWEDIARLTAALPEEYSVIVTADHGGHDYTHGTTQPEDMTIPVFFYRTPLAAGELDTPVSIKDLAPTVTALLGVEAPADWKGRALV